MNTRKPRVNKKRIAKAMKPLNGLNFPGSVSHIPEKIEFPKVTPNPYKDELVKGYEWNKDFDKAQSNCSVWSFVVPALLILVVIGYCYSVEYIRQDITPTHYITDSQARPDKSLEQKWYTDKSYEVAIEKISSDLENGHWAKADRELHNLKLALEGNADREPARTKGIDP
jgi:hypothetical protein